MAGGADRISRGAWIAAAALFVVLAAFGGRYGYHRDELYFIEAGRHLAWSQPDQPMLVPLLATGWHIVVGGHLWLFRLLPAAVSAGTVLVAALSARELGATGQRQTWAAAATALTSIVPGTGHFFSTTTFDIFGTALTLLLVVRALGRPGLRPWLWVGLAAGVTMEVKVLVGIVLGCCLLGLLATGPRAALRGLGPYAAAAVALVLAAPNLLWQATHGWPMLEIGQSIASGGSTSSVSRGALLPLIALMAGPLYAVVIGYGVVWLLRRERRPRYAWLVVGFGLFVLFALVTGAKAYYPAGFFPLLLAAGAIALPRLKRGWLIGLPVVCAIPTVLFSLPASPVGSAAFRMAAGVNPDGAETVGWPAYVDTVAKVSDGLSAAERAHAIVLGSNYGEAGMVALARRDGRDLPPAYSGHNAFGYWGPPPAATTTAVVVGWFEPGEPDRWFVSCRVVAHLRSPRGVDNDEAGAPVRVCTDPRESWAQLWPRIRHLG